VYTKRGDTGETSLYGPGRVPKDSPRVEAYGTVDELNSFIGLAISDCSDDSIASSLKRIQSLLFVAGADLASDAKDTKVPRISNSNTEELEKMTDEILSRLPKLTSFILPGGSRLAAEVHIARAVCRRAERRIVTLSRAEDVNPALMPFFNRLSTYLFNLARLANASSGKKDEVWSR
jgi:cob(I)alamin adenosyltransferase